MKSFKVPIKIICGFCSGQVSETDENITETHMDMIQILLPDLKLLEVERLNRLKICRSCDIIINEIFKFKSTCLELEDTIYNYKTEDSKQLDLKQILGLTENSYSTNQICRTCFGIINNDLFVFICNDNTLIKQHQEKCLSEVDLSLTRKPAMCIDCVEMLQKYFSFISLCLPHLQISTNEKKIENNSKSNTNFKTKSDEHKTEQTPTEYTNTGAEPIIVKSCPDLSENSKKQKVEEEIIVIEDSDEDDEINHFKHQAIEKVENDCSFDANSVMNPENVHSNKNHKLRLEKDLDEEINTSTIENPYVREMCLISNLRGSVPDDELEIGNKSEKVIANNILCKHNNSETNESQKSERESIPSNEFATFIKATEKVDVDNKQNNNEAYESQKINDHTMDITELVPVNKLNILSTSTEKVKTNGILEQNNNESFESPIINNFMRAEDPITKNYSPINSENDKCPKDNTTSKNNNSNFCENDLVQICIDSDQNDNDDTCMDDTVIFANHEFEAVNCNNNSNATNNEVQEHNVNDKHVANETINNHNNTMKDKNANDDMIIIENDIDTITNISPNLPGSDLKNTTEKNKSSKYKRKLRNNTSGSNTTRSSKVFSSDYSDDDDPDFDPMDEWEYIENKQTSYRRPLKSTKYYYCKSCRCRKKTELELLSHTVVCKKRQTENPSIEATVYHELQQLRAQVDRLERLQSSVTQENHNKKQKTISVVTKESEMPLLADTGSSFKQTAQPVLRLILTQTNVPNTSIMLPSFSNNPTGFVCSSSNNSYNTPAESQNCIRPATKSLRTAPSIVTAFPETLHTQANSYFSVPNSFVTVVHETESKTIPLKHASTMAFNNMQPVSISHNTQHISTISSSITIISDEEKSLETIDIVDDETPSNLVFMEEVSDNETEVQASELDPLDLIHVPLDDPIINLDTTKTKNINTASTETKLSDAVKSVETDLARECHTITKNISANSSKVNHRSKVSFFGSNNLTENNNDMNSIISDLVNVLGYDSTISIPEKSRTDIVIEENNDGIFSNIINENADCEKQSSISRCEKKSNNEFTTEDNHNISNAIDKNINVGKRSKINQTKEYNSDQIKLNLTVNTPKDSSLITNLNPNEDDERKVSNNESNFDQNRRIDIPVVLSASSRSTTNSNLRLSHQFQIPQLTKRQPLQIKIYRSLSVNQLIDRTMLYTVLNHHMIKHYYILAVLKCDLCNFNTRYFRLLGLHILTHFKSLRDNETYQCDKCNERFLNKLKLNDHFITDHLSYSYKPLFWCVNCAHSFPYEIGVQNHRVSCDRKDILVKLFKCSNVVYCMLCSFETTNTAKAKMHGLICKERKMSGDLKL